MAEIKRFPFLLHLQSSPTSYVRHTRNGKVTHEGVGVSFWFRRLTAALSEVPVADRELPLVFHARTSDHQDVVVQASVTYRFAEPARAATRLEFDIDPATARWRGEPLDQVATLLTELAQQHALALVAQMPLTETLATAPERLRTRIEEGLAADERLAEIGVAPVAVRVGPVRPEPDMERALGTPARELVRQDADRATFERRAIAVENERAIAENELHNQIELARREEELIAQRGHNEKRRVEDQAAASRIEATAHAEGIRVVGEAEAEAERARVGAYGELPPAILLGLALKELAGNLPPIERLAVSPDLLTDALAQIAGKQ